MVTPVILVALVTLATLVILAILVVLVILATLNVVLMRRFCEELGISIRILFTKAGHGKSPCDGVGGNVKTQFENIFFFQE